MNSPTDQPQNNWLRSFLSNLKEPESKKPQALELPIDDLGDEEHHKAITTIRRFLNAEEFYDDECRDVAKYIRSINLRTFGRDNIISLSKRRGLVFGHQRTIIARVAKIMSGDRLGYDFKFADRPGCEYRLARKISSMSEVEKSSACHLIYVLLVNSKAEVRSAVQTMLASLLIGEQPDCTRNEILAGEWAKTGDPAFWLTRNLVSRFEVVRRCGQIVKETIIPKNSEKKDHPIYIWHSTLFPDNFFQLAHDAELQVSGKTGAQTDRKAPPPAPIDQQIAERPKMTRDEYLVFLERELQNPLKKYSFEDTYPHEEFGFSFTVEYSRTIGTMNSRELFILKNILWSYLGNLEDIPPGRLDARLLIAALWGDGKGKMLFKFTENMTRGGAEVAQTGYLTNFKPKSVDEAFADTLESLETVFEQMPSSFAARWFKAHLEGRPTTAATTSTSDLQKSQVFSTQASPFGLPLGKRDDGAVIFYNGNRALVTIAPPESRKSLAQAMPALRSFAGHVFVLDLKGHFYEQTADHRRRAFDSHVINFNPLVPNTSRYNPLQFVSDSPDECWGEVSNLAQLIIPITNARDASWETMAQRVLALYLAYTVLTEAPDNRQINRVLDLVAGIGTDEAIEAILDPKAGFPSAMQRAAHTVKAIRDPKSHAQYSGILQALDQNLSIWNDPRVERATSQCDWAPIAFRGPKPVSVYLTIPLDSIGLYAPLIRVITAQHVFQLMRQIPKDDTKPILFLLDEFPQMGRMDPIRKAIEVGREYKIRTWLFAQFARQFEDTYGESGKGLIDICGVRMFMNPSMKDAEDITKEFGKRHNAMNDTKVDAMPADLIIGPEYRNSVFVMSTGESPRIIEKNFPR